LRFPSEPFSGRVDPRVGEGRAFATILQDASARRYGIELDAYSAEQAATSLVRIIQGNCLQTHCAVESFSCIYLNPPYDWALAGSTRERLEPVFLNHTFRWLIPGGVLLFVIPAERAGDCAQILASHFKQVRTFVYLVDRKVVGMRLLGAAFFDGSQQISEDDACGSTCPQQSPRIIAGRDPSRPETSNQGNNKYKRRHQAEHQRISRRSSVKQFRPKSRERKDR
jgi:hypothetical protein